MGGQPLGSCARSVMGPCLEPGRGMPPAGWCFGAGPGPRSGSSEHTGVGRRLLPSSGVSTPLPTGPSPEQGSQSQQPAEGPLAPAPELVVVLRPRVSRAVLARSRAALPGISDSCLQLQLFPDKRLAPPRLGLGLFGECCRGGLSCSLLQECWPDGQILLPSCKMSDVGRLWESSLPVPPPLDKPAWPAPPCHGNGPFQPQPQ